MNFETWLQSDLTKPLKVQALHGVFFSADNAANLIGAEVYDGGAPASLSGTCIGYAIRADGGTLTITGTVSGNKASIILPTSAYVIEGPLDIVIKVISGSVKTTVGACRGYVQRATTDTIIDPGHVIPSLEELLAQIDACEQATEAANTAASNANSKATAANTAATNANTATGNANTATTRANTAAAALENMDATASGLAAGATPTATVSTVSNHYRIAFGIPKGDKGDMGDTGAAAAITNTATAYQNSTSGTTIPTGTWQTTQPDTPQGQFLWIRTILTWNNGQTSTLYSVSRMGIDGSGSVVSVNDISPDANGNVTLPVDATPTSGSTNPVTSGGVYTGLDGKVNKSGDTMTGQLTLIGSSKVKLENSAYNTVPLSFADFQESVIGQLTYEISNRRWRFVEYDDDGSNFEGYRLPTAEENLTANKYYEILTSKTPVTIAQGGTGAENATDALTNLGIGGLVSSNTTYATLADFITFIQSCANSTKIIVRVHADVLSALTGETVSLNGLAILYKASANNAYYFAFNRDTTGYGNISLANGAVNILHNVNLRMASGAITSGTIATGNTATDIDVSFGKTLESVPTVIAHAYPYASSYSVYVSRVYNITTTGCTLAVLTTKTDSAVSLSANRCISWIAMCN